MIIRRALLGLFLLASPALAQTPTLDSITLKGAPTAPAQVPRLQDVQSLIAAAIAGIAPGGATAVAGTTAGTFAAGNDARIVGAAQASSLSAVATSGSYTDLANKPAIPSAPVAGTTAGTFAAGNDARISGALQATAAASTYLPLASAPGLATSSTAGLMRPGTSLACVAGVCDVVSQATAAAPANFAFTSGDTILVRRGAAVIEVPYTLVSGGTSGGGTTAPSTTSDSTLSAIPASTVAGQQLSGTTIASSGTTSNYFVLWNVATGAEAGARFNSSAMNNTLFLLIPQTAGTYTIRSYDAGNAGNKVYESAQFNVTAAPGPLPPAPVIGSTTNVTSTSLTMNWSASSSATAYRFLARPEVGTPYGSLADASVSGTSYNLTGLAPSSYPRGIVLPQNANGYGPPSEQIIGGTSASTPVASTYTLRNAGGDGSGFAWPTSYSVPVSQGFAGVNGSGYLAVVQNSGTAATPPGVFAFGSSGTAPPVKGAVGGDYGLNSNDNRPIAYNGNQASYPGWGGPDATMFLYANGRAAGSPSRTLYLWFVPTDTSITPFPLTKTDGSPQAITVSYVP